MEIEITMNFHYVTPNVVDDFNKQNSYITSGHVKWYNHFWKRCGHFLLTQMYPEDIPREMKTHVHKKTYTTICIVAWLIIEKENLEAAQISTNTRKNKYTGYS